MEAGWRVSLDCCPGLVLGGNTRVICANRPSPAHENVETYPATLLGSIAAHSPVSTCELFHTGQNWERKKTRKWLN